MGIRASREVISLSASLSCLCDSSPGERGFPRSFSKLRQSWGRSCHVPGDLADLNPCAHQGLGVTAACWPLKFMALNAVSCPCCR